MPELIWSALLEAPRLEPNDSFEGKWAIAGCRLLNALVDFSDCQCAIIRMEGIHSQKLALEGYAFGNIESEVRNSFSIPENKSLNYWSGNAFESCFVQHYPNGSLEAYSSDASALTDGESRFLNAVHWRASFPLQIGDELPRIAILLSLNESVPAWLKKEKVAYSWLAGQLIASQEFSNEPNGDGHAAFVESSRHLPILSYLRSENAALSALLRILVSGNGLGWHRAWLMKKSGDIYVCQQCAGGATYRDWANGASFVAEVFDDLVDEIAHDVLAEPRKKDTLWQMCAENEAFRVPATWFARKPPRSGGEEWFSLPKEMGEQDADWNCYLDELASSTSHEFDPCPNYHWCPFTVSGDDFVLVLGHWEFDRKFRRDLVIESGCLISAAVEITNLIVSPNDGNLEESENDESDSICGLLSWLGMRPITRITYDGACARIVGMMFQTSGDFRRIVHDEMQGRVFATRKMLK